MPFNFDQKTNRYQTNSLKYDFTAERGKPADVIPLWVADMDFQSPPKVLDALHHAVNHGVFGYSEVKDDYTDVLANWFRQEHRFTFEPEWLVKSPGVVTALAIATRAYTKVGDAVLIQTPVYYPFLRVVLDNQRQLIENELIIDQNRYSIDFADFEAKIIKHNIKLFLFCSPHNPIGRVWTQDELKKIVLICKKHQVILISDEIHMDLVFAPHQHLSIGLIDSDFSQWVLCTAASKTFNLPGLQVSNLFIPDTALRNKFKKGLDQFGYSQHNILGLVATKAAYQYGKSWLEELKTYLFNNYQLIKDYLFNHLPNIKLFPLEGTYLGWLDFRALNLKQEELNELIVSQAKLWLVDGTVFGKNGHGFQRINIATQKETLHKALNQLKTACQNIH